MGVLESRPWVDHRVENVSLDQGSSGGRFIVAFLSLFWWFHKLNRCAGGHHSIGLLARIVDCRFVNFERRKILNLMSRHKSTGAKTERCFFQSQSLSPMSFCI